VVDDLVALFLLGEYSKRGSCANEAGEGNRESDHVNVHRTNSQPENLEQTITYRYFFVLGSGARREFHVRLTGSTLNLIPTARHSYPPWTHLDHFQCPNCRLETQDTRLCPVAANVVDLVEFFGQWKSFEEADIQIESNARVYMKRGRLDDALRSLMGIYMAASGCPVMDKLKPMVFCHLPFATAEETIFRAASMYLLAQYFRQKRGQPADWDFSRLISIYRDVQIVNENFCKRLSMVTMGDASLNAVTILDMLAKRSTLAFSEEFLSQMERYFGPYLEDTESRAPV